MGSHCDPSSHWFLESYMEYQFQKTWAISHGHLLSSELWDGPKFDGEGAWVSMVIRTSHSHSPSSGEVCDTMDQSQEGFFISLISSHQFLFVNFHLWREMGMGSSDNHAPQRVSKSVLKIFGMSILWKGASSSSIALFLCKHNFLVNINLVHWGCKVHVNGPSKHQFCEWGTFLDPLFSQENQFDGSVWYSSPAHLLTYCYDEKLSWSFFSFIKYKKNTKRKILKGFKSKVSTSLTHDFTRSSLSFSVWPNLFMFESMGYSF